MLNRSLILTVGLSIAPLAFRIGTFAQNYGRITSADGWPQPTWDPPRVTAQNKKPEKR